MTVMALGATFAPFMTTAEEQRGWINRLLKHFQITHTKLAREVGIDPSTLSKFLGETAGKRSLSAITIGKIEAQYRVRFPAEPTGFGFREPEAVPFDPAESEDDLALLAATALCQGRNATDPWVLKGRVLEGIGLLPGDILVVDLNETPKPGDVVCAQVYGPGGTVETVFRIFQPPFYLVGAGPGSRRPILADGQSAMVRGVVIGSFRPRGTSAAVA